MRARHKHSSIRFRPRTAARGSSRPANHGKRVGQRCCGAASPAPAPYIPVIAIWTVAVPPSLSTAAYGVIVQVTEDVLLQPTCTLFVLKWFTDWNVTVAFTGFPVCAVRADCASEAVKPSTRQKGCDRVAGAPQRALPQS